MGGEDGKGSLDDVLYAVETRILTPCFLFNNVLCETFVGSHNDGWDESLITTDDYLYGPDEKHSYYNGMFYLDKYSELFWYNNHSLAETWSANLCQQCFYLAEDTRIVPVNSFVVGLSDFRFKAEEVKRFEAECEANTASTTNNDTLVEEPKLATGNQPIPDVTGRRGPLRILDR
jgi:hypothetical protein